jgi:hypothetical protein
MGLEQAVQPKMAMLQQNEPEHVYGSETFQKIYQTVLI